MAKKKTTVALPGGIKNLVHTVQNSDTDAQIKRDVIAAEIAVSDDNDEDDDHAQVVASSVNTSAVNSQASASSKSGSKSEKSEKAAEELDSWTLFLNLAGDYKKKQSKLSTVYIDSNLKDILDRLRSAEGIKLPSTAILSSIVARFVYDHEKEIKKALFGDKKLL